MAVDHITMEVMKTIMVVITVVAIDMAAVATIRGG